MVASFVVLGGAIVLFAWNRLPVGVVAILTALALWLTGAVDLDTALSGFGDPIVIFIATLFVVSEGLEQSGITAWAGQVLTAKAGTARTRLLVALMALGAVMAAVVTPNGAAAALLPVAVLAARQAKESTSQMLMPLAFAASGGALLALSGSTVNVIVSDTLKASTGEPFGFFEFAIVGVPLVAVTVLVAVGGGRFLLPRRTPSSLPSDFSGHVDALVDHYQLDHGFFRLRVDAAGKAVGRRWSALAGPDDVHAIGLQRADGEPAPLEQPLAAGDVLVVTGAVESVSAAAADHGMTVVRTPLTRATRTELLNKEVGVAELVVPPRSEAIGRTFFPGIVRDDVTVLGINRLGKDRGARPTTLAEGDMLLVHGTWPAVEALAHDQEVLLVDSPALVRRQTVALGPKAPRALAVLVVTIVLLAGGLTTPAVAGLVGAVLMVLTGVVNPQEAYRAVSWQTVVLVGGLIPLSVAIQTSGAAEVVADAMIRLVGDGGGYALLAALFVLTATLGQVVSNTATVLIVTPIAVAAAAETGVALAPVLMLVAVAGAASFLTPIATPANMLVMGPGGYRFGDYWKLGLATMVAWLAVALLVVPLVWPFD
ncbi:SLC13 family permease [Cellulomonas soli]|nr:SLC13 family permease [Cellulomonas soli]